MSKAVILNFMIPPTVGRLTGDSRKLDEVEMNVVHSDEIAFLAYHVSVRVVHGDILVPFEAFFYFTS